VSILEVSLPWGDDPVSAISPSHITLAFLCDENMLMDLFVLFPGQKIEKFRNFTMVDFCHERPQVWGRTHCPGACYIKLVPQF